MEEYSEFYGQIVIFPIMSLTFSECRDLKIYLDTKRYQKSQICTKFGKYLKLFKLFDLRVGKK